MASIQGRKGSETPSHMKIKRKYISSIRDNRVKQADMREEFGVLSEVKPYGWPQGQHRGIVKEMGSV